MTLIGPGAPGMAFMMKKKKYKFTVDLHLEELVEVPFLNAVLFAKIRLLEGGSFQEYSNREEVKNHTVEWKQKFEFPCKMSANASTGILDPCILRISIRKEIKGGRSYQKLGFIDLNLAEFAGSGLTLKRCLLEGYDTRHRQDNSMLRVAIRMHMISGDILFKVPSPSSKTKHSSQDDTSNSINTQPSLPKDDSSTASGSSGFGSLTKKKTQLLISNDHQQSIDLDPQSFVSSVITDSGISESSELISSLDNFNCPTSQIHVVTNNPQTIISQTNLVNIEQGHSRNSSNTSQLSKGSGYSSFSHSQHSRQSSEGDNEHQRAFTGGAIVCETNSLDRMKTVVERRKKVALDSEPGAGVATLSGRVEETRVNPDFLIEEILKNTKLNLEERPESSGLQLYIARDGTASLGSQEVKSGMTSGVFKQVVMKNPNPR
uniref:Hipothetical protein n=1 Tax=Corethrella appendiculata TaxID=1370023 RepID=U5EXK9_9DIPT